MLFPQYLRSGFYTVHIWAHLQTSASVLNHNKRLVRSHTVRHRANGLRHKGIVWNGLIHKSIGWNSFRHKGIGQNSLRHKGIRQNSLRRRVKALGKTASDIIASGKTASDIKASGETASGGRFALPCSQVMSSLHVVWRQFRTVDGDRWVETEGKPYLIYFILPFFKLTVTLVKFYTEEDISHCNYLWVLFAHLKS